MSKIKKEKFDLHSGKKWLLIADVFEGPWADKVKSLTEKYHGKMVPVPHNMNYFQPLDLTVKRSCKLLLRDKAQRQYAEQIQA